MPEEKLPEWFEKDFFLHDKQQRSWDELEVGEEYETVPFTVTAERIAKYVEGTKDYNPVFCDEEAAKKTRFGGIIAPPTIVVPIVFATTPPDIWIKMPGAINPGQKLEFGVPVRPGDEITVHAVVTEKHYAAKDEDDFVVLDVWCENQDGSRNVDTMLFHKI